MRVGGLEEALQAGRGGGGVVVEQPDPFGGLDIERLVAVRAQDAGGQARLDGRTESVRGSVTGLGEDDDAVLA
jgi:hypothetical protein